MSFNITKAPEPPAVIYAPLAHSPVKEIVILTLEDIPQTDKVRVIICTQKVIYNPEGKVNLYYYDRIIVSNTEVIIGDRLGTVISETEITE